MRLPARGGAISLVVVASFALPSCHRADPPMAAGVEAGAFADADADAGVRAIEGCTALPAGGVLVARAKPAPYAAAIAAYGRVALAAWLQTAPGVPCRGGSTCVPVDGHGRWVDFATTASDTAAEPPAVRLSRGSDVEGESGFAAVATRSGGLYGARCAASVVSGRLECGFSRFTGPELADASWSFETHNSVLVIGRGAATAVGDTAMMIVPALGEMYLLASGTHAHREFIAEVGPSGADRNLAGPDVGWIDAPALTPAGADQAVATWRSSPDGDTSGTGYLPPATPGVRGTIRARLVGADGHGRGHVVTVSAGSEDIGAPAVAWLDGAAHVVYAHRRSSAEPWHLAHVVWTPGSAPSRAEIATTGGPAVAPAVVAEPGATGCLVLGWTEGEGHATVARAGRLCGGSAAPSAVGLVSGVGVEAGASAWTADGRGVFAVWQELPGKGAPAELRVARVSCARER